MKDSTVGKGTSSSAMETPQAALERRYINDYLLSKGYTREDLDGLPKEARRSLLIEASIYASNKLAEEEQRVRLVHEMHGRFERSSRS